jgi:hypothetical protein
MHVVYAYLALEHALDGVNPEYDLRIVHVLRPLFSQIICLRSLSANCQETRHRRRLYEPRLAPLAFDLTWLLPWRRAADWVLLGMWSRSEK